MRTFRSKSTYFHLRSWSVGSSFRFGSTGHSWTVCDLCDAHLDESKNVNDTTTSQAHNKGIRVLPSGYFRSFGGSEKSCGRAVLINIPTCMPPPDGTSSSASQPWDGGLDNTLVKKILTTEDGQGKFLVVSAGGRCERAVLGDMIAQKAAARGWEGVLIDGAVRDSAVLRTLSSLGVWAKTTCPVKTLKIDRGARTSEVKLCNDATLVRAEDWVYADSDGIIVSPKKLH